MLRTLGLSVVGILLALPAIADAPDVEALIRQLSAPEWKTREAATKALEKLGSAAEAPLRAALERERDPEVQVRLRHILERIQAARAKEDEALVDREREADLAAYRALRPALHGEHKGKWVVIAGGKLAAAGADHAAALKASEAATREARHRYVFQAGSEPLPEEDWKGHGSLRSGDIGMGLRPPFVIVSGGGQTLVRTADGRMVPAPALVLSDPQRPGTSLKLALFWNTGFRGVVCLEPAAAAKLGLARHEIPGIVKGATITPEARPGTILDYPARRAWVLLGFDGHGKQELVEAIVPTAR